MQVRETANSEEGTSSQAVASDQSHTEVDKIQKVPDTIVSKGVNSEMKTVLKIKSILTDSPPPKIVKTVQFQEGEKLKIDSQLNEIKTSSDAPIDKIPAKVGSSKSFSKRSCFTCHQKGHVASVCPNKKGKTSNQSSRKDDLPEQPRAFTPEHIIVNKDRTGLGYQIEPRFQKSQPRFCPSNYKVRSNSPSLASTSGSSIGTSQQRSNTPRQTNTPKRTITPVRHQTPNRFKHRYPNSLNSVDTNVSNLVPAKFTDAKTSVD